MGDHFRSGTYLAGFGILGDGHRSRPDRRHDRQASGASNSKDFHANRTSVFTSAVGDPWGVRSCNGNPASMSQRRIALARDASEVVGDGGGFAEGGDGVDAAVGAVS